MTLKIVMRICIIMLLTGSIALWAQKPTVCFLSDTGLTTKSIKQWKDLQSNKVQTPLKDISYFLIPTLILQSHEMPKRRLDKVFILSVSNIQDSSVSVIFDNYNEG